MSVTTNQPVPAAQALARKATELGRYIPFSSMKKLPLAGAIYGFARPPRRGTIAAQHTGRKLPGATVFRRDDSMKATQQGLGRVMKAARYSWQGFKASWQTEAAFREEAVLAAIMVPLALWLDLPAVEKALLVVTVLLVLVVELINSALEAVVDRVGLEHHVLSGKAKDVGSAAVFTMLLITGLTWVLIVGERYVWG